MQERKKWRKMDRTEFFQGNREDCCGKIARVLIKML
jgi:hypothetical protein